MTTMLASVINAFLRVGLLAAAAAGVVDEEVVMVLEIQKMR